MEATNCNLAFLKCKCGDTVVSIDGCPSDTRGLELGQQQWAFHNHHSTGTVGHTRRSLQPLCTSQYPTFSQWWDIAVASFVCWLCGSGRCYSGCQTHWGILTGITWPGSSWLAPAFHPNLWILPATAQQHSLLTWKHNVRMILKWTERTESM